MWHPARQPLDRDNSGTISADELATATKLVAGGDVQKLPLKFFPKRIQGALEVFDADGDHSVSTSELVRAAELFREEKTKTKKLTRLVGGLAVILLVVLVAIFGLTFAVVEMSKDTGVSSDGRMTRKADSTVVIKTGAVEKPSMALASCMSDEYFEELATFNADNGLARLSLSISGFARTVREKSVYGTVVTLITSAGTITLDGEMLEFSTDVGDIFVAAGFDTTSAGRRLAGLYELTAFFNAIPEANYGCFDPKSAGPKPVFPPNYKAHITVLYNCDERTIDAAHHDVDGSRCKDVAASTLVSEKIDGQDLTFVPGHAHVWIDTEESVAREEWHFPARSDDYTLVKTVRFGANAKLTELFMLPGGAAGVSDASRLVTVPGEFCASKNDDKAASLVNLPDETLIAYEGSDTTASGGTRRSFVYTVEAGTKELLYRFTDEATAGSDVYEMKEIQMWDLSENLVVMVYRFNSMDATWSAASEPERFWDRPTVCHTTAQDGGMPVEQVMFTASPYPDADEARVELLQLEAKQVIIPNRFSNDGGVDRKLLGNSCCKHYYDGQSTGIAFHEKWDFDIIPNIMSLSIDLGSGHDHTGAIYPDGFTTIGSISYDTCHVEVSVTFNFIGMGLPLGVVGTVYADWKPVMKFNECFEAAGCVGIFVGVKVWKFDVELFRIDICLGGGRYEVDGCMRVNLFAQISAGFSVGNDFLGLAISGSLFNKFFLPNPDCDDPYANELNWDPFLQVDWEICFFICYTDSWGWHFFGPEPGKMLKEWHGLPPKTGVDALSGLSDGIDFADWMGPNSVNGATMTGDHPVVGFEVSRTASGTNERGDLTTLKGAYTQNLWNNLGLRTEQRVTYHSCQYVTWHMHDEAWNYCPSGTFLHGMRRGDAIANWSNHWRKSKRYITHYEHPVSLINAGYCCNAQIEENNVATVQINHGECMDMDMPREWKNGGFWKFKAKAAAAVCDPGYVMAGLHRDGNGLAGNHQELNDIDYFRCCKPAV